MDTTAISEAGARAPDAKTSDTAVGAVGGRKGSGPEQRFVVIEMKRCRGDVLRSNARLKSLLQRVAKFMGAPDEAPVGLTSRPTGRVDLKAEFPHGFVHVSVWPREGDVTARVMLPKRRPDLEHLNELLLFGCGAKAAWTLVGRSKGRHHATRLINRKDYGRVIFEVRTPFQLIELSRGRRGTTLLLNHVPQFVEASERKYHEPLVHVPMAFARRVGRVCLGGAGDGLALREVLRWSGRGLDRVTQYEIDPFVAQVAKYHPELVRMNSGSLHHPRARVEVGDIRAKLTAGSAFDVVILDFPSLSDGPYAGLYSTSFYRQVAAAMADDGVVMVQNTDYTEGMADTLRHLRRVFRHHLAFRNQGPDQSVDYVMASNTSLKPRRGLPRGLEEVSTRDLKTIYARSRAGLVSLDDFHVAWL
jgi:spermidine synthase